MVALMHFFSVSAALMRSSMVSFVCAECGARAAMPLDDVLGRHGEDCTISDVVADASCHRCGSPFIVATPCDDGDDDECSDDDEDEAA